jgi:hypothetical protein
MKEDEKEPKPGSPHEEAEEGNLIRSAGRRPAIPAADLATIKQAARDTWRETVRAKRTRELRLRSAYALAASLVLVILAGWWWLSGEVPPVVEEVATVELLTGRVEAVRETEQGPGEPIEIGVGDNLSDGVVLTTATGADGSPGRVAFRTGRGQSVRLDVGTQIRLLSSSRVRLEQGAIYVDSGPSTPEDAGLEIVTSFGTVREVGTQYEVRLDGETDTLQVRVREGSVSVRWDGESDGADRGETLTLRRDGSIVRGAVEPDGPEWGWVLAAAPSLDIEGRSLASFLDWVARESGWEIRYADGAIERSAGTIRLHGTIEGLRPDESLQAILEGSGLDHRTEDGVVLVFRP